MMSQLAVDKAAQNRLSWWKVFVLDESLGFRERPANRVVFVGRLWPWEAPSLRSGRSRVENRGNSSHRSLFVSHYASSTAPPIPTHLESRFGSLSRSSHLCDSKFSQAPTCASHVSTSCFWCPSHSSILVAFEAEAHGPAMCIDHCLYDAMADSSPDLPMSRGDLKAASDFVSVPCRSTRAECR